MWTIVGVADVPPAPWKNGGGVTRQLVAWPVGVPEWTIRVSIADVEQDGPFSSFEGIRRWFGILEGVGVNLFGSMDIVVGDPLYEFDGGLAPSCTLLEGHNVRDFNVMLREAPGRHLSVVDAKVTPNLAVDASTQWVGLFSVDGGSLAQRSDGAVEKEIAVPKMGLAWLDQVGQPLELHANPVEGRGVAYWLLLT
ncbi:hypothetical protein H310_13012 [Aphanomyces invadans]|uniref:HutD family protein n=1 Tax=Aphanomyces invadans TaxID=157072 RepID=A0A024THG7_9STRA|nr:hypothetical protein H310_13012 [Aphanomyces invadans]ETV92792.1 hypothetical protein H310_13012 [Aphanomyces invadans]|eukprot:XP_008878562.1 hypothetical protein H310_13012 [Aphanomyces invadans]